METSSQCQVSSLAAFHVCIWGRVLHGTRSSSVYLCHLHSKPKDLPVFSPITMIAVSCHHGCHFESLVLGIVLRSHDCTAGAWPTKAVSHPSVHLCRGQLSISRCINTIPLHLSFFEFCFKSCHLAVFLSLLEFLSKLSFRKCSSGQKHVWRPLLRWLMKSDVSTLFMEWEIHT